jgi:hypothetical protein
VDLTAALVGHQELTGVGPEGQRRYSWSFNISARGRDRVTAIQDISIPVNLKDAAVTARYDHIEAK